MFSKTVAKSLLKKALGPFLKKELVLEQIEEVSVSDGVIVLKDLDVNTEPLNTALSEANAHWVVKSVQAQSVRVEFPWYSLVSTSEATAKMINLKMQHVEVSMMPGEPKLWAAPDESGDMPDLTSSIVHSLETLTKSTEIGLRRKQEQKEEDVEVSHEGASEGLQTLAILIRELLYNIELEIEDLVVGVSHTIGPEGEEERVHAMLVVPHVTLHNIGDVVPPKPRSEVSREEVEMLMKETPPLRKAIRFSGVTVKLVEDERVQQKYEGAAAHAMSCSVFPMFEQRFTSQEERRETEYHTTTIVAPEQPEHEDTIFVEMQAKRDGHIPEESIALMPGLVARCSLGRYNVVVSPKHAKILLQLFGEQGAQAMAHDYAEERMKESAQEKPCPSDEDLSKTITDEDKKLLREFQRKLLEMTGSYAPGHAGDDAAPFVDMDASVVDGDAPFVDFDSDDGEEVGEPLGVSVSSLPADIAPRAHGEDIVSVLSSDPDLPLHSPSQYSHLNASSTMKMLVGDSGAMRKYANAGVQVLVQVKMDALVVALSYDSFADDKDGICITAATEVEVTDAETRRRQRVARSSHECPHIRRDHMLLRVEGFAAEFLETRLDAKVEASVQLVEAREFVYKGPLSAGAGGVLFDARKLVSVSRRSADAGQPDIKCSVAWVSKDKAGKLQDSRVVVDVGDVHAQLETELLVRTEPYVRLLMAVAGRGADTPFPVVRSAAVEEAVTRQEVEVRVGALDCRLLCPLDDAHSRMSERRVLELSVVAYEARATKCLFSDSTASRFELACERIEAFILPPAATATTATDPADPARPLRVTDGGLVEPFFVASGDGDGRSGVSVSMTTRGEECAFGEETLMDDEDEEASRDEGAAAEVVENFLLQDDSDGDVPGGAGDSPSAMWESASSSSFQAFCYRCTKSSARHLEVIAPSVVVRMSEKDVGALQLTAQVCGDVAARVKALGEEEEDAALLPVIETMSGSVFSSGQSLGSGISLPPLSTPSERHLLSTGSFRDAGGPTSVSVQLHLSTAKVVLLDRSHDYLVEVVGLHLMHAVSFCGGGDDCTQMVLDMFSVSERLRSLGTQVSLMHPICGINEYAHALFIGFRSAPSHKALKVHVHGLAVEYSPGQGWLNNLRLFFARAAAVFPRTTLASAMSVQPQPQPQASEPLGCSTRLSECVFAYPPFGIEATALLLLPRVEVSGGPDVYEAVVSDAVVHLARSSVSGRVLWPARLSSWNAVVSHWENTGFVSIFSSAELSVTIELSEHPDCELQQISCTARNRGSQAGICTDSLALLLGMVDDWASTPDSSSFDRIDAMTRSIAAMQRQVDAHEERGGMETAASSAGASVDTVTPARGAGANAGLGATGSEVERTAAEEGQEEALEGPPLVSVEELDPMNMSVSASGRRMGAAGSSESSLLEGEKVEVQLVEEEVEEDVPIVDVVSVPVSSGSTSGSFQLEMGNQPPAPSLSKSRSRESASTDSGRIFLHAVEPLSEQDAYREEELELIIQQFAEMDVEERAEGGAGAAAARREPEVIWHNGDGLTVIEDYLLEQARDHGDPPFFKLPAEFGVAVVRACLRDFTVTASLYAGEDWGCGRDLNSSLRVSLRNINAVFDQLASAGVEGQHNWRLALGVGDLEIDDMLLSSTWNKFLCYDQQRLRPSDSNMIEVELYSSNPLHALPPEQHTMKVSILPLRLFVDQDALELLKMFGEVDVPTDPDKPPMYFAKADIAALKLNIDYKPRRVAYADMLHGDFSSAKNLFALEQAQFDLKRVSMSNMNGWGEIHDGVKMVWFPYVQPKHVREYVSGMQAVRPIAEVAKGAAELILLPIEQYQRDGRVLRGLQYGASSFLSKLTTQTLDVASKVASGAQIILENTDEFWRSNAAEAAEESRAAQQVSNNAEQPSTLWDGTKKAYERMAREMSTASHTIVAVPVQVYEQTGVGKAAVSVIRAVPVAVIRPTIGLFGGLADVLKATRNQMDPSYERVARMKYVTGSNQ